MTAELKTKPKLGGNIPIPEWHLYSGSMKQTEAICKAMELEKLFA